MPPETTPLPNIAASPTAATNPPSSVIDAARLFGEAKEIQIELDGVRYRLRITRRGKLILQK